MDSIERLENVLNGEPVDRPPFSFWHHFGVQHMDGQAVASVHIAFARRFQTDFVKVMNDYPYPIRDGLSLDRMTDILQMRALHGIEGSWSHQLMALEKIHQVLGKEKWIVDTIYSPWTILGRLFGVDNVIKTAGSRPEIIKHGLEVITESLINYIKEASPYINGIYFSLTEADYSQLNPFEHYKICFPYNQSILEAAENKLKELKKRPFNILRLKGHRVFFESVKGYSSAAASWEHFRTRPGLAKGLLAWKRPILGGIDGETLHRGTPASIKERFEKYSVEYLLKGLIIAPTCSLSTNVSPYLLEALAAGVNSLAHFNPDNKRNNTREVSKYPGMEREGSADWFKKTVKTADVSDDAEMHDFADQLRASGDVKAAERVEMGYPPDSHTGESEAEQDKTARAAAGDGAANAERQTGSAETERIFAADTDIAALISETDDGMSAPADDKRQAFEAETGNSADAAENADSSGLEDDIQDDLPEDGDDFMPPDVELDDIDDIYADDFDIYEDPDEVEADGDNADSADKPRQAWKENRRGFEANQGTSRDGRAQRSVSENGGYRYRRQAADERSPRGGSSERGRRGGYGSRDGRDSRSGYSGDRRDGYRRSISDDRGFRGGYAERDRRGGYGNRTGRDARDGYEDRGRRGGYGVRSDRDLHGGYGSRGPRNDYGRDGRDGRGGYGDRDRKGGYGDRDRRSDYAGHTSRDSGRKVIRIRKQK